MRATFVIKKQPKINNPPMAEYSLNLVALIAILANAADLIKKYV
jgi:hypothetical protein